MLKPNQHYANLKESYLFTEIAHRVNDYTAANPGAKIIRMGIGDVTRPLPSVCVQAMQKAAGELGVAETFRGYGPEQGYDFLRAAIAKEYQAAYGVQLAEDEIFISDGAKSDLGNFLDLLDGANSILVPDPVYPVYVDTNIMAGRQVQFLPATAQNGFLPVPTEDMAADVYYICSPNNPTGAVYDKAALTEFVRLANKNGSLILFDSAYASFVKGDLPRSIYEIEGAETCAVEIGSFSKMAGFTGTRCGWTIVPKALKREGMSLRNMWLRRQTTKFNGVSYPVQRAAEAVFTPEGKEQTAANIACYGKNTQMLTRLLRQKGIFFTGGENSPYVWLKTPDGMSGWDFFDLLLQKVQVVGTPGEGFGQNGAGFFRLTGFSTNQATAEAVERLATLL